MKVRFLEGVTGPDIIVREGEVRDLSRPDALYWIRIGLAEKVEPKPKQKKVTVQRVRKTETR